MNKPTVVCLILLAFQGNLKAQATMDLPTRMLGKEINRINGETNFLSEVANSTEGTNQSAPGRFYAVSASQANSPVKYAYVGRVNTCRAGGCAINNGPTNDRESEYFDYFILFDSACSVRLVRIFNYQATHGHEVTAKSWLKQFIGYHGETELNAGKNVDAISGATISVNAINFDIEYRTGLIRQMINPKQLPAN